MFIVNGDGQLARDLEDRLVPGHNEVASYIIKSLELHEMFLSDQQYAPEVRHEETSALQD